MPVGHVAVIFREVFVAVPVAARKAVVGAAPDLHEPHAPLQQPPGDQAVGPKVLGDWFVEAVQFLRRLRLVRDIEHFGRAELQPGGQLVGARCARRAASRLRAPARCARFSCSQQLEAFASLSRGDELRRFGRKQVGDRIRPADADHRALMRGRQKAGPPVARPVGRKAARVGQHDERRQIVGQASQPVGHPRPHAGKARQHEAGVLHERGRAVDVRLRDHRMDERDVVDARGQVRHQVAHPFAALAVLLPVPRALHARRPGSLWNSSTLSPGIELLAVRLISRGL